VISPTQRLLYLTPHNNQKKQTFMLPAGVEPTIPASLRPQNQALDRTATGIVAYRDDRNPVNIQAYSRTSVIVVQHSSLVSPIVDVSATLTDHNLFTAGDREHQNRT
jgi:hypothetical protein